MSVFSFVKSRLSILDIVLEYVQLKQMGGYWKGSCPFHSETDASFTVSPDKQIFYCFGCHVGGDVVAFTAKIENLSQMEAVRHLIDKYNIQVPSGIKKDILSGAKSGEKEQFFKACEVTAQWGYEQLLTNKKAVDYVVSRNIPEGEWKRFTIGYFPGGNGSINRFLKIAAQQNILTQDLIGAGVIAKGRSGLYSPFEERIIFPIYDVLGRCCGFGGRVFHEADERAKYYNSKESEWFSKGKLLFGLNIAKKEMQYKNKAFLVEGYTDCVAMVHENYKNTVATLGTACTSEHLKLLARYISTLYVLYDGDAAGQKAILRLTKLCWDANLDLQIVQLPNKEDPASFIENGGDVEVLMNSASDIFSFFVNSLGEQFWGKPLSEKIVLCEKIIEVIAKINDPLKRDVLLQQAAHVTQMPLESLKSRVKHSHGEHGRLSGRLSRRLSVEVKENNGAMIERKIAALMINSVLQTEPTAGRFQLFIEDEIITYFSAPVRAILEKVKAFSKTEPRTFDLLLSYFDNQAERDWIIEQSFLVDEGSYEQFESLIFQFRKKNWKHIVQAMKNRIFNAKKDNDQDKLEGLLSSFLKMKKEMKERGLI
jgi:DNA primase